MFNVSQTKSLSGQIVSDNPIILDTARSIADPQVRNMATVGGNLAHGDPANDHLATMLALEAEVVATGKSGQRTIPVERGIVSYTMSCHGGGGAGASSKRIRVRCLQSRCIVILSCAILTQSKTTSVWPSTNRNQHARRAGAANAAGAEPRS